jgi:hypothetical protein
MFKDIINGRAILLYEYGSSSYAGCKYSNCTFQNVGSAVLLYYSMAPTSSFNITNCFFFDSISTYSYSYSDYGFVNYEMSYDAVYSFTGNIFFNIIGDITSVVYMYGSFTSFDFSSNSFSNITSSGDGGVFFFFITFSYFFLILYL